MLSLRTDESNYGQADSTTQPLAIDSLDTCSRIGQTLKMKTGSQRWQCGGVASGASEKLRQQNISGGEGEWGGWLLVAEVVGSLDKKDWNTSLRFRTREVPGHLEE